MEMGLRRVMAVQSILFGFSDSCPRLYLLLSWQNVVCTYSVIIVVDAQNVLKIALQSFHV